MTPPWLEALRTATRGHHQALDQQPVLQALLRPAITIEQYADALQALYRPQMLLETALTQGAVRVGMANQPYAPRLPALTADLQALAPLCPPCTEPGEGEAWQAVLDPATCSVPVLTGWRYVLEGARLGSEVLAVQVRRRLGEQVPCLFLGTAEAGRHWPAYLQQAAQVCADAKAVPEVIEAACQAFRLYQHALTTRG